MGRRFEGTSGAVGAPRYAALLACAGAALSLGVASLVAASAASFGGRRSYRTGSGPVSVAIGDLNGDGRPDVVTANLYANSTSVLRNRGDGTFQPRRDYRAGGDPRSVAIADLNRDGKPDLVSVNADANTVSVLLNSSDRSFQPRRDYATVGPVSVAIGDLNGDGRLDVVTANRTASISVLLNRGNGRLRPGHEYRTGPEPVSVAIGDLNGDGRPDLVTANFDSNTVSVLRNRGDGSFQPRRDYATGRRPMAVAIGDLNRDGKLDVATANLDANTVSVLLNRGRGTFQHRRDYRAGGDQRSVAIRDLNRDGKPDLLAVNADASTVSVLLNSGDGSFQRRRDYATGRHPVSVAVGDLNGDGRPDLVTANLDSNTVSVLPAKSLVISKGRTSPPAPLPAPPAPGLLLWNKLGSAYEVTHSAYGPKLAFFACTDPTTPHFGRQCTIDVPGKLAYPGGVFGGAASITGGPYFAGARVHTSLLRTSILNPEHGAVEAWYRQSSDPVPDEHNPHRIFGGPYSLTGVDEVGLFSQDRLDSADPRLHFIVFFGEEPPPFTPPHVVAVRSLVDGVVGYRISVLNGRWIHVAGVWDRKGIAGSTDTVRLYVNGEVVAVAKARDWGTTPCGRRVSARPAGACFIDVAGCNDTCANTFAVDNLKIWNYAKTDYSDRFKEGFLHARG